MSTVLKMGRRVLLGSVMGVLLASTAYAAPSFDLPTLMQAMGKHKERTATFVETKVISTLKQPQVSKGEVRYVAPNTFEKHTYQPWTESFRVQGNKLELTDRQGRNWYADLNKRPHAAAFVNGVVGLLSGNKDALERNYKYTLTGSLNKWTLTLVPKDAKMLEIITKVVASGDSENMRTLRYEQADGDRSTMEMTPTNKPGKK